MSNTDDRPSPTTGMLTLQHVYGHYT